MAQFGMKSAANLILVDKRTGLPALYIAYANATSTEWSSDAVYATANGVNAITWENSKTGTLTLDTEIFDLGLLAMVMGSEIKDGTITAMTRRDVVVRENGTIDMGTDFNRVDVNTVNVIETDGLGGEHVGLPIFSSSSTANLPGQVRQLSVTLTEEGIRATFSRVNGATGYQLLIDDTPHGEVFASNTIDATDVSLDAAVVISVRAVNDFGTGPKSAVIRTTGEENVGPGQTVTLTPTAEDLTASYDNNGVLAGVADNALQFEVTGSTIDIRGFYPNQTFAIYYMEVVDNARTISVDSEGFNSSYEIFGDGKIRMRDTGEDRLIRIHYPNARPQSNFTLTQSATEPTALSIVFDLFPSMNEDGKSVLAEFHFIQ